MAESLLHSAGPDDIDTIPSGPTLKQMIWNVAFVFVPSFLLFVGIDIGWIALVAGKMYREALGDMLRGTPDIVSGLLAWVCIVSMLQLFALEGSSSVKMAATRGAVVGLLLYGTFTLTNHAVIQTWTWALVAGDAGWGSLLCGAVTAFQYWLAQRAISAMRH